MSENDSKNIVLERIIITDPIADKKTCSSGSCLGMIGIGNKTERTWYPSIENIHFNFLRAGTYKIRMIPGKNYNVETVFQIYTCYWSDFLIHPTRHYGGLRGCIAPGKEVTLDDRQVLLNSREAHNEIIAILGGYVKHKEFEFSIKNNPPTKGNMTKERWVAINEKRWKRIRAEKIKNRKLQKQKNKPPGVAQLDK